MNVTFVSVKNHPQKVHHPLNVNGQLKKSAKYRRCQKIESLVVAVARRQITHDVKRNVGRHHQNEAEARLVPAQAAVVVEADGVVTVGADRLNVTLRSVKRRTVFKQRGIIVLVIVPKVIRIVTLDRCDEIIVASRHLIPDDVAVPEVVVAVHVHPAVEVDLGKFSRLFGVSGVVDS